MEKLIEINRLTINKRKKQRSLIIIVIFKNKKSILLIIIFILLLIFNFTSFALIFKYKGFLHYIFSYKNLKSFNHIHFKFGDNLPRTSLGNNTIPSLDEIFNSRILYISDAKISRNYIKYIRPIDEKEEEKYKKRYSKNETYVNPGNYKKRKGQYDFKTFAKICIDEKLIDSNKIEYHNKPLISVVLPSYNKQDRLIMSVRSIQNQNFKNIEIIIVNDCSTDNSTQLFLYLLNTDPRIRIFHHTKNMGCWRSRIDGFLYSKSKYVILFDTSDIYEDNFVLEDAYNTIVKYNLDTVKFLFRIICNSKIKGNYEMLEHSRNVFHVNYYYSKIIYEPKNIFKFNKFVFGTWGNIWTRLTRANIFTKGLLLLNDKILNFYKNVWDDVWFNSIFNYASYSFLIFGRVGYIYLQTGRGAGSFKLNTENNKDKSLKEFLLFLYFDYHFLPKNDTKTGIIKTLRNYNSNKNIFKLSYMKSEFYILNDLLDLLIKDPYVKYDDKIFLRQLLNESNIREKNVKIKL